VRTSLLTKTASTSYIPLENKSKEGKRIYANFDKETAERMFGYRIKYKPEKDSSEVMDPNKS